MPNLMTHEWFDQNERINLDAQIEVGTRICDAWGREGIVREIDGTEGPVINESTNSIAVVLIEENREELYTLWGWKRDLRVLR